MNVQGDFAILRAGRNQKVFRAKPQFQLFQNWPTLGNRLNQEISGARERVVDRRGAERDSDVDDGANIEPERLEMFEKKAKISSRRICTQQPKPGYLQRTIDTAENG